MSGMPANGIGIIGMGAAMPSQIRTNDWWGDDFIRQHQERARTDITTMADTVSDVDPEVIRHATEFRMDPFRGTKERRVISEEDEPSDLEARAAARALEAANVSAQDVDLLLVYSLLPDVPAPLNHPLVAAKLGLRSDVMAVTLASGCASFVSQLYFASKMLHSGDVRHAVIVQSAVMSRISDYRQPSSVNGGDGAMAAVVSRVAPEYGFIGYQQYTRGELHAGIRMAPEGASGKPWYRGDVHHSRLTAQNGDRSAVHEMGARTPSFCRQTCTALLEKTGYEARDVDFFCVSQPTAWFGKACCDAMGIPQDRTLTTFETYGHLMAASAPTNLWTAQRQGRLRAGDLVLIYSPGAGFIQSAGLCRWSWG